MNDSLNSIEELLSYPKYSDCITNGYEISYGKPTPSGQQRGSQKAIYCKNYQQILDNLDVAKTRGKAK